MSKAHLIGAVAAGIMLSASAHAALVPISFLGDRFYPGFESGYVDAVFAPDTLDVSGTIAGGTTVDFNRPLSGGPGPIDVSIDSPIYGDVTVDFTQLASLNFTPAGEFYTMAGSGGFISVNLAYYGVSSFGFTGIGSYTPAPPPPIDPPPACIVNCGGGIDPPPIVVGAPETSTWAMMLMGFVGLGFAAHRRAHTARLASI